MLKRWIPSVLPPTPPEPSTSPDEAEQTDKARPAVHDDVGGVGKTIVVKGELSGGEDLTINGHVEGKIELRDHVLTVGSHGRITAQVTARTIVVLGHVTGNLVATENVVVKESGSVEGDIMAPRVAIADGSYFRGTIDMQPSNAPTAKAPLQRPEPSSVNGEVARV